MRKPLDPPAALDHELSCWYNGDELGSVRTEAFRTSLPRRAFDSAERLRQLVGEDKVAELIGVLETLKSEPNSTLMRNLMEGSQTWWADAPQDWAIFQNLVDQIIKYLQPNPGPRPAWTQE